MISSRSPMNNTLLSIRQTTQPLIFKLHWWI